MWIKITALEQLEALHEGSLVAIYPLQGAPRAEFDDSDPDQVAQRLVSENDKNTKMIHTTSLQRKEEAHTITSSGMGSMILGSGYVNYADIIEAGIWWIQQGL
ncbi:MAG: hypothetical protein KDC07_04095 [Chitinophagaceae bacterium]|nr:hypothetical protein [Chitinophagaceae bacterium]MCB9047142.1 hypothetical protein [Chitinophagales bacterium]